jgi:hypothetical protein
MHRHHTELREALRNLVNAAKAPLAPGGFITRLDKAIFEAEEVLYRQRPCDLGLFADRAQLDLADRKDL